ncbi:isoprenyl transferase [Fictibacillus barbaricus]|uniref:Isoprenyl transferase n=1 Tax=Fictibacillus barbaricus TaxID=182136 RepID=A0ABS2ZC86_9BACL|nr:isoprenyl transferase [Fictibacillus barbaricus]MBN3545815.1 isoprenyl transferase [Fictibacillus barbaricus]GGB56336.1 isoprenyl transferase [Fictibacillus barbaricus]
MLDKLFFKRKNPENNTLLEGNIPSHVAIIMDGNGRWARKRALPRIAGHHEGMKTVRKIVKEANKIGINVLTLYAFSTENWKRPRDEVDFLMKLPGEFLNTFLPDLIKENVQVRIMGKKELLPMHTIKAVDEAIKKTENNTGLILNFALNYGSRDEITGAVKTIASEIKKGNLDPSQIDESLIESYLMTQGLSDPDLLIRTSGEVRLSNFMLWQLAYSEFWFTEVFWPDFSEEHLREAVSQFAQRGRRYGGV